MIIIIIIIIIIITIIIIIVLFPWKIPLAPRIYHLEISIDSLLLTTESTLKPWGGNRIIASSCAIKRYAVITGEECLLLSQAHKFANVSV